MEFALPLDRMTVADKLRVMEVLWDDLARNPDQIQSPPWHEEVLDERRRQIEEGRAKYLSLEEFRRNIEKEIQ
ncbi:MAG: addiction module protein [Pirellulales bacterium]|nr:addiction module protein [Pirellulales bacterium]